MRYKIEEVIGRDLCPALEDAEDVLEALTHGNPVPDGAPDRVVDGMRLAIKNLRLALEIEREYEAARSPNK